LSFLLNERLASKNFGGLSGWSRHHWTGFIVIGIFGLVPASTFLAWGTERSTASNVALIYLTVPILTAVLASIILGERQA
jgi:drug/metabolite transporter (DMT)-like permease